MKGQRVIVQWDADAVKQDPTQMPDQFFRFGNWQPIYEEPAPGRSEQPRVHQFCSTGCTIDYLRHVDPPLSPKEQAAIAENNKQVELKKMEKEDKKQIQPVAKIVETNPITHEVIEPIPSQVLN